MLNTTSAKQGTGFNDGCQPGAINKVCLRGPPNLLVPQFPKTPSDFKTKQDTAGRITDGEDERQCPVWGLTATERREAAET